MHNKTQEIIEFLQSTVKVIQERVSQREKENEIENSRESETILENERERLYEAQYILEHIWAIIGR